MNARLNIIKKIYDAYKSINFNFWSIEGQNLCSEYKNSFGGSFTDAMYQMQMYDENKIENTNCMLENIIFQENNLMNLHRNLDAIKNIFK